MRKFGTRNVSRSIINPTRPAAMTMFPIGNRELVIAKMKPRYAINGTVHCTSARRRCGSGGPSVDSPRAWRRHDNHDRLLLPSGRTGLTGEDAAAALSPKLSIIARARGGAEHRVIRGLE